MFTPLLDHLNPIDLALAAFLVLAFPALQLASSLRPRPKQASSTARRYLRSMAILAGPLIVLAIDWLGSGRSLAALGLALPPPFRGLIGLGIAGAAIAGLVLVSYLQAVPRDPARLAAMRARMKGAGPQPASPREYRLSIVFAFVIGCGTELLFRGYLLWALAPIAGLAGAVSIAALAYGIGHGFRNRKQALMAILSALVFTAAYVATGSLWWLMLIHTAAALQGGWAGYRLSRAKPA